MIESGDAEERTGRRRHRTAVRRRRARLGAAALAAFLVGAAVGAGAGGDSDETPPTSKRQPPAQLRELTRTVQEALPGAIVCADQEGGDVRTLPWAGPQGSAGDQQAAGTVSDDAAAAGRALEASGVNVTLAPVAD